MSTSPWSPTFCKILSNAIRPPQRDPQRTAREDSAVQGEVGAGASLVQGPGDRRGPTVPP